MLLREKGSDRPPFGTSPGLGNLVLRMNEVIRQLGGPDIVEEVDPASLDSTGQPLKPLPPTSWALIESRLKGRYLLKVECPKCHKGQTYVSDVPNALAEVKRGFFHCGKHEQCPEDIFENFKAAVTAFEKSRDAVEKIKAERERKKKEVEGALVRVIG